MRFCSLSSGSSGNCLYIETKESKFLIDAGLSGVKVERLMEERGLRIQDLDFILVTHEHSDHAKGVGVLSRRYDLPVFANQGTWDALRMSIGSIKDDNIRVFETGRDFAYRDLGIKPIRVYHDCQDPVGYLIYAEGKKLSMMTDTGLVTSSMVADFKGSHMFFMEANFDPAMLANGPYPENLRRRISGNEGHLSNEESAELIGKILSSGNEKVFLGHLSNENNLPILAKNTVESHLMNLGISQKDLNIEVAKRFSPNDIHEL